MKRSLGALLFLVVLAAPAFVAPAMVWTSPTSEPADEEPDLRDNASLALAHSFDRDVDVRMMLSTEAATVFTLTDSADDSASAAREPTMFRIRAATHDESLRLDLHNTETVELRSSVAALMEPDPEQRASAPPVPLHALMLLEAQRTLVAVGVSAHPSASGAFASASLLAHPPAESFVKSILANPTETGMVPGWMLHATWILLLVAIGLTLRPVLMGGLIGLFSRFTQSDVLEHERRSQLFAAIQADPGASLGELCQRTMLAAGVVQHHVRLLEQHELVRRVRDGRTTRFYPRGPRFAPPALRNETRQRLVEIVRRDPSLDAKQLADRLGQRPQSTWHHLRILEQAGVLTQTREGRSMQWRAAV